MFNRKDLMVKLGTMMTAFGFIIGLGGSWAFVGEPQLPKKLQQ